MNMFAWIITIALTVLSEAFNIPWYVVVIVILAKTHIEMTHQGTFF
jgi:hypothetical protein